MNNRNARLWIAALAVILFLPAIMPAAITTCPTPTGSGSAYLTPGFTCTTGPITFSDFKIVSTANPLGTVIPPSTMAFTPITTDGNVGFQLAVGMGGTTQPGAISMWQDILWSYRATAAPGTLITGLALSFNGGYTGTGSTSATENFCKNALLISCPSGSAGQLSNTNPPANFNAVAYFAGGVQSYEAIKDILGTSGVAGTYYVSYVNNTTMYESVPEPATFLLSGLGLLALGLRRRQRG